MIRPILKYGDTSLHQPAADVPTVNQVIERMELSIGMPVAKGKPIGYLHSEMADLAVRKAEVAASIVCWITSPGLPPPE